MARKPRAVAVDIPHHVTHHGSGRQQIFFSDRDYAVYRDTVFQYAERYSVRIWGYCLMDNHVHWIAVPERPESLARTFGRAASDYARYGNLVQGRTGHFWQARFYSCALDANHAWHALAYVERNPVRAGMVRYAADYRWSSAQARLLGFDPEGRLDLALWAECFSPEQWRAVLAGSVAQEALERRIREATRTGAPLGDDGFIARIGKSLGRCLHPRPPGRPRREPPTPTGVSFVGHVGYGHAGRKLG